MKRLFLLLIFLTLCFFANGQMILSVLYFENTTRNEEYNWLSKALTDMIITDIKMPSVDGLTFIREQKRKGCQVEAIMIISAFINETIEKYKKLQTFLNDCKWFPMCPMKRFYEEQRLERKWIELYCKGDWTRCVRYELEEQSHYHPD